MVSASPISQLSAALPALPKGTFAPVHRIAGWFLIWFGAAWISAAFLLGWVAAQPDVPEEFMPSPNQELAWSLLGLGVLGAGVATLLMGLFEPRAPPLLRVTYGQLRCPWCDQELMSLVGRCPYCNQPLEPRPPPPPVPPQG